MAVEMLVDRCHGASLRAGWWWENGKPLLDSESVHYIVATKLALIHSEISEAMEGYRTNAADSHLPNYTSITVELADALIRIFDLAGALQLPIGRAFVEKLTYNASRADHKPQARAETSGKKF